MRVLSVFKTSQSQILKSLFYNKILMVKSQLQDRWRNKFCIFIYIIPAFVMVPFVYFIIFEMEFNCIMSPPFLGFGYSWHTSYFPTSWYRDGKLAFVNISKIVCISIKIPASRNLLSGFVYRASRQISTINGFLCRT